MVDSPRGKAEPQLAIECSLLGRCQNQKNFLSRDLSRKVVMSELNSGRPKPWNIYGSSYPSPSQTEVGREGPWNSFGTSMNAISFGFVATAILISMFLIMAIFEHLFRPNASFLSSQDNSTAHLESPQVQKLGDSHSVSLCFSILHFPV